MHSLKKSEPNKLKNKRLTMAYQVPEPKIFACTQSTALAEKIAKSYGAELGKVIFSRYSDGEFQPSFEESVRGTRVFIIGSTNPSSENLMEMLLMLDAAKRASARHITAVMPYFGWARQDRKDKPRVPIAAKLVAKMLEAAGATRIITMDLHADQIQGFFEKPVDHLFASTLFLPYLKKLNLDNLTIASPDMGGSKRAYAYSKALECDVVICYKQREKANVISHMELIGDVQGKNVVLVDDMVDTAGTLTKAADLMIERGAISVRAITTHGLLSGDAYEKIEKSKLSELIITDSIPTRKDSKKVKVLSCADLFADVMERVHNNTSISSKFLM
ncbi:ribose-phosphate pyrophosphokinase [Cellulophaga tyrosinoxydans]|uniref:ribose-phosphate diphosphokinase n=2 Tax=Cellulophaga tyrosinoxydans TaxID=504486 RepID=A0A1W1YHH5_9FLAO|nr:ribose-phosphate pyrophosphokinase [Cellulophaga tyrosinoxydans]